MPNTHSLTLGEGESIPVESIATSGSGQYKPTQELTGSLALGDVHPESIPLMEPDRNVVFSPVAPVSGLDWSPEPFPYR